ncbi:MAG: hypothetical protein IJV35_09115 [Neisseriaceae bacterium]|nr:hypothetical protein [Neisseriaceae bacterium]
MPEIIFAIRRYKALRLWLMTSSLTGLPHHCLAMARNDTLFFISGCLKSFGIASVF